MGCTGYNTAEGLILTLDVLTPFLSNFLMYVEPSFSLVNTSIFWCHFPSEGLYGKLIVRPRVSQKQNCSKCTVCYGCLCLREKEPGKMFAYMHMILFLLCLSGILIEVFSHVKLSKLPMEEKKITRIYSQLPNMILWQYPKN